MRMRTGLLISLTIALIVAGANGQQASVPEFGTTNLTYYRVGTTEFKAYAGGEAYFDSGWDLWTAGGTGWFNATPHLPNGALLTYLELDYCDTNTAGLYLLLGFQSCNPIMGSCQSAGLGNIASTPQPNGAPCTFATRTLNHTVNNATELLSLFVQFGAFDETNRLRGVVIGYKLQVSPAPATPTFNDVPTTDPGFQFIEALA